jgi:hypothetical protein
MPPGDHLDRSHPGFIVTITTRCNYPRAPNQPSAAGLSVRTRARRKNTRNRSSLPVIHAQRWTPLSHIANETRNCQRVQALGGL